MDTVLFSGDENVLELESSDGFNNMVNILNATVL